MYGKIEQDVPSFRIGCVNAKLCKQGLRLLGHSPPELTPRKQLEAFTGNWVYPRRKCWGNLGGAGPHAQLTGAHAVTAVALLQLTYSVRRWGISGP